MDISLFDMVSKNTWILLRFPFSFFLMPVYFFALSQALTLNTTKAILVFFILHFLIYPASNAYNSYMDRDIGSIGLLKNPPRPTRQLYLVSMLLDLCGLVLSYWVNLPFAIGVLAMILASRAYSYRKIRLKRFPLTGFLTVVLFQGCLVYLMVYMGCSASQVRNLPWEGMVFSGLLFGGFYPLTQIYQHEQDRKDGVITLSYILGYRGTYLFCGLLFVAAEFLLWSWFSGNARPGDFFFVQYFFLPVVLYFLYWAIKVFKNHGFADFPHAMRMNLVASIFLNGAFIGLTVLRHGWVLP